MHLNYQLLFASLPTKARFNQRGALTMPWRGLLATHLLLV
jgi:hypothetical protein